MNDELEDAINENNIEEVKKLITVENRDEALFMAGNEEIIKFLIENGADVNFQTEDGWTSYGWTALMSAVEQGNIEISKLLIENGADVNLQNENGWSALKYAIKQRNIEISKLLIDNGADVNLQNSNGNTILMEALLDKTYLRTLIESANIDTEYQAEVLDGGHLHICPDCKVKYYGRDIINKLKEIDLKIIKDYKDNKWLESIE